MHSEIKQEINIFLYQQDGEQKIFVLLKTMKDFND